MAGTINILNSTTTISNNGLINAYGDNSIFMRKYYIVGTILYSALSESEMENQNTNFYLCDGRSCSGTKYETITGNSSVPDLRGRFLRGLDPLGSVDPDGGSRTLLDEQDYKTALPTTDFTTNDSGNHTHYFSNDTNEAGSGGKYRLGGGSGLTSSSAGNHSHTVNGGGDNETRPKNTSINYYIVVN